MASSTFAGYLVNATVTQIILAALVGLFLGWALKPTPRPYKDFPRVPRPVMPWPWSKSVLVSLKEGYNTIMKQNNQSFTMKWWAVDYLVMHPKYFADLKAADPHQVSFFQNLSDALQMHCSVGDLYWEPDRMIQAVSKGMNSHLTQLTPLIYEEATTAFKAEIGDFEGWKEFTATKTIFPISHRISCRFLITEELCRNEDFIKKSTAFVESIFLNALVIKLLPLGLLRDYLAWPLSFGHRRKINAAVKLVQPVLERRMREREARGGQEDPKQLDGIEWILSQPVSRPKEKDPRHVTLELLHNLWAAASSPGVMVVQLIYKTLEEPQYLDKLRHEAKEMTEKYGWTEKAIQNLHLLDSFIREVNRMHPPLGPICTRTVKEKPWVLSDGTVLPVGTRCIWPGTPVLHDPDNYNDPMKFDGFRFYRLAKEDKMSGEAANKWAAGAVSPTNLTFGYGPHACPGRFYGLREVKIMFSKLILEYDFKWDKPRTDRPADFGIEGQYAPNLWQKIALKKRS